MSINRLGTYLAGGAVAAAAAALIAAPAVAEVTWIVIAYSYGEPTTAAWGEGATQPEAEAAAVSTCRAMGGTKCAHVYSSGNTEADQANCIAFVVLIDDPNYGAAGSGQTWVEAEDNAHRNLNGRLITQGRPGATATAHCKGGGTGIEPPPPGRVTPPKAKPAATVAADVDVYNVKNEPEGAGQVVGILRAEPRPQKVELVGSCAPESWCQVSGPNVPGGNGWVWGHLELP
jgi:hypothetical protein